MSRAPATTTQTTLYRLRSDKSLGLERYVQDKYFDRGFDRTEVRVGDQKGLFIYGAIAKERADWVDQAHSLTGVAPSVGNMTSAGVLLLPYGKYVYALTWGMGFLVLAPNLIDTGFGLRFAIRRANPRRVRSVTTNAIDVLPRTAKTSVLGGAALSAFRIEELGDLLGRMVVSVDSSGLSCAVAGDRPWITIRGADALNVPLGKEPAALMADIRAIHDVVESSSVVQGLEHLEGTRPLRSDDPVVQDLNNTLASQIASAESTRIALSWPSEWDDERGEASRYVLSGFGRGQNGVVEELDVDDVLSSVRNLPEDRRLDAMKRAKVQAVNNDGDAVSRAISVNKWLTFECDLNSRRYVYSRGQWYNVSGAYLELLKERLERVFSQRWTTELPAWPTCVKVRRETGESYLGPVSERRYNQLVAAADGDITCLDRKLLYTEQHPGGIESCDLLGADCELVHVKRLDDSVSASHLFNQALVSAEALCRQVDALARLKERVAKQSDGGRTLPDRFRPSNVVFAFAGRPATLDALFTFSQVTLHRCVQRLSDFGINVLVTEIADGADVVEPQ